MPELNPKIVPERYVRQPFYVDAVQVTSANMEQLAKWCNGDIRSAKPDHDVQTSLDETPRDTVPDRYIKVRVVRPANDRQTMAFVGDWILYAGTGYKVYTDRAFQKSFEKANDTTPLHVARSAKTGEFVSAAYAEENPDTTVVETHRDAASVNPHSHVVTKKEDGVDKIGIGPEHSDTDELAREDARSADS